MRQPGNEKARDFSNCGGPCVNLGGHDGHFVENGSSARPRWVSPTRCARRSRSKTEIFRNLKADNASPSFPGARRTKPVIDAHYDGWFDGAGDNADGLRCSSALARHFAKPENKPRRTLVFVASAGHHTPGLNGPRGFIAANPALAAKALLMLNIEHVAQRNFAPSRERRRRRLSRSDRRFRRSADYARHHERSPFLNSAVRSGRAALRRQLRLGPSRRCRAARPAASRAIKGAKLTMMQAPPLYHTTGEVLDVISTPGLERIARFFAYFVKEVDKATVGADQSLITADCAVTSQVRVHDVPIAMPVLHTFIMNNRRVHEVICDILATNQEVARSSRAGRTKFLSKSVDLHQSVSRLRR